MLGKLLEFPMTLPSRPSDGRTGPGRSPDEVPIYLDLLRADLYRLLDELARAEADHHSVLVMEFERAWTQFKAATAREA